MIIANENNISETAANNPCRFTLPEHFTFLVFLALALLAPACLNNRASLACPDGLADFSGSGARVCFCR